MWAGILAVAFEVVKFLCKWGMDKIDQNADRRKARAEVKKEINDAKDVRSFFLGVTRYNAI
jgi:hypothetical protein